MFLVKSIVRSYYRINPDGTKTLVGSHNRTTKSPSKIELVEMLDSGLKRYEIAEKLGVNVKTVTEWLENYGMKGKYAKTSQEYSKEAVRLHQIEKMSIKEVANRIGITRTAVAITLRKNNALRTQSESAALRTLKGKGRSSHRSKAYHWQSKLTGKWEPAGSKYELVRMSQLDDDPMVKSWTKTVETVKYGNGKTYIPDFYVEYKDGRVEVEEVKPKFKLSDPEVKQKILAGISFFTAKGIPFKVVTEDEIGEENLKSFDIEGFAKWSEQQIRDRKRRLDKERSAANPEQAKSRKDKWRIENPEKYRAQQLRDYEKRKEKRRLSR